MTAVFRYLRKRKGIEIRRRRSRHHCSSSIVSVFNPPPPSHGNGFCCSPMYRNERSYYLHAGCTWKKRNCEAKDYTFLYRYWPRFRRFKLVCDVVKHPSIDSARFRHSMISRRVNSREYLVIFGGIVTRTFTNDLTQIDVTDFNNVIVTKIRYRVNLNSGRDDHLDEMPKVGFHGALYDKKRDKMFVYGGKNSIKRFGDVFEYDFAEVCFTRIFEHTEKNKSPILPTSPRLQSKNRRKITLNFLKKSDESKCYREKNRDIIPSCPTRRSGFSMHWVGRDKYEEFVVFGGLDINNNDCNDTYLFNIATKRWKYVSVFGEIPAPRSSHTSDIINDQLIVFGGADAKSKFKDMYILDLRSKFWRRVYIDNPTLIPQVYIHRSGFRIEGDYDRILFFSFGGLTNEMESLDSMFEFDITNQITIPYEWKMNDSMYRCSSFVDMVVICHEKRKIEEEEVEGESEEEDEKLNLKFL